MTNQLGLNAVDQAPAQSFSTLATCPDCSRLVSYRAEHCPSCGLRLRPRESQQTSMLKIAGGVIMGYFGILIINVILGVIIFIFFAGAIAAALSKTK
jgi:hypothetical protein